MESFCIKASIAQEFLTPITPQQNGVVERKDKVIQEMANAMIHNKDMTKDIWGEVINIACHIVNRVYFRLGTQNTPYKLWKVMKINVKYVRIFGNTCFILKDNENVGKFDTRSDEGILLGYSSTSKAYKVLNKRTRKVMETVNVVIDEASTLKSLKATKQTPKSVLPLTLDSDQEVGDKNPSPPTSFSVIQGPKDSSTSL